MTSVYLLSKPVQDITPADMITEETESKRPNGEPPPNRPLRSTPTPKITPLAKIMQFSVT